MSGVAILLFDSLLTVSPSFSMLDQILVSILVPNEYVRRSTRI